MDLLHGNIKTIYFRYLAAAFGSALISSIYGLVDMAMVGQYQGPDGTAALAVVAPVWNIIYSLGLLTGTGGSVLFSIARGRNFKGESEESLYFTAAFWGTVILSLISWAAIILFDKQLLMLFGAGGSLLPLAAEYLLPVKFVIPAFLFNQMLAAFLRNDRSPVLATGAVLAGGIFNIIGDYLFVFVFDFGIFGAGLATALGSLITLAVMMTHFLSKNNSLKLVFPGKFVSRFREIVTTGFATFFIDIAMGILTMMFNRQIMKYSGAASLAVYGVIVNISTIVQCCAYSVGQAAQPIISMNFGAGKWERIRETLKCALAAVCFFSLSWTAVSIAFPNGFIRIFMAPTDDVLAIAPRIIRCYAVSFLLLPLNIFSTYYFQSIMKPAISFLVSVCRGMILSGLLIYALPVLFGAESMWFSMPVTEAVTALAVIVLMARSVKKSRELPPVQAPGNQF